MYRVDSIRVGGYHESRRCSRDTYPESCITQFTSIRRLLAIRDMHRPDGGPG